MALNHLTQVTASGIHTSVSIGGGGVKQLVIGVRVGTAVTFNIPGDTLTVLGRSGNITVNV
jgi:hypothetical protein